MIEIFKSLSSPFIIIWRFFMKKVLFVLATFLGSTSVFAAGQNVNTNIPVTTYSNVDARNQGVAIGSDLSKSVGYAAAPALTTTLTETCMGSTSVGGGFSGGSFSFGTTWRDSACVRRLDAREIKTFGDVQAAKEIMCDSDLVRAAFKRVGRPCAEDGGLYVTTPEPAQVVAPVAEVAPATDVKVHDEQDEIAQRTQQILDKAEADRAIMKQKYGW
jgi:hypothetical protein